jgi:hypothetical protein
MLIQYGLLKYLYDWRVQIICNTTQLPLQQLLNENPAEAETSRWLSPNAEV